MAGVAALVETPLAQILLGVILALALFYLFCILHAARGLLRSALRAGILGGLLFLLGLALADSLGYRKEQALPFVAVFALGVPLLLTKRRSRQIPRSVRRRVIARDLKGEPFDPKKHHIDHILPFSRGGGHTEDNLRVVSRAQNLRKGKRMPRLRDWF